MKLLFDEVDRAIELGLREREVGAGLLHLRVVYRRVEAHQRRTLRDALAFLELNRRDTPRDLGPHRLGSSDRRLPTVVIDCGRRNVSTLAVSTGVAPGAPPAPGSPATLRGRACRGARRPGVSRP